MSIAWFFNTKLGRTVMLVGVILIAGGAAYWWADGKGYERCKQEARDAIGAANVARNLEENKRDDRGSEIAKSATAKAEEVVAKADEETAEAKTEVEIIYRDPPKTKPVKPTSCVHPLDPRAQKVIDDAVSDTNRRQ